MQYVFIVIAYRCWTSPYLTWKMYLTAAPSALPQRQLAALRATRSFFCRSLCRPAKGRPAKSKPRPAKSCFQNPGLQNFAGRPAKKVCSSLTLQGVTLHDIVTLLCNVNVTWIVRSFLESNVTTVLTVVSNVIPDPTQRSPLTLY